MSERDDVPLPERPDRDSDSRSPTSGTTGGHTEAASDSGSKAAPTDSLPLQPLQSGDSVPVVDQEKDQQADDHSSHQSLRDQEPADRTAQQEIRLQATTPERTPTPVTGGTDSAKMNGLSFSELCCLFCCPPCPGQIAAKLAFLPPEPTYSFIPDETNSKFTLSLTDRAEWQYSQRELEAIEVFYTRTTRGNRIGCMFIRAANPRFTILFSHGNAVDLGQMSSFYLGLGSRINCNVFSYDYSGYGVSSGACPVSLSSDLTPCVSQVLPVRRTCMQTSMPRGSRSDLVMAFRRNTLLSMVSPLEPVSHGPRPLLTLTFCSRSSDCRFILSLRSRWRHPALTSHVWYASRVSEHKADLVL